MNNHGDVFHMLQNIEHDQLSNCRVETMNTALKPLIVHICILSCTN